MIYTHIYIYLYTYTQYTYTFKNTHKMKFSVFYDKTPKFLVFYDKTHIVQRRRCWSGDAAVSNIIIKAFFNISLSLSVLKYKRK